MALGVDLMARAPDLHIISARHSSTYLPAYPVRVGNSSGRVLLAAAALLFTIWVQGG